MAKASKTAQGDAAGLTILRHSAFAGHAVPPGHPERPDRIATINAMLDADFVHLPMATAPNADRKHLGLVHSAAYIDAIFAAAPKADSPDIVGLDSDTLMSAGTLPAALAAAGGAVEAVRRVLTGEAKRVFVAARPPGHHAEPSRAMGFCFFSNAAIAGKYALAEAGLDRVAVVDFDVHHGNGTQACFWDDSRYLFASSHQMPLYPGTGAEDETGCGNIFNAPIAPGTDGASIVRVWQDDLLPKIAAGKPELIIISAGFDAHARDPLGGLNMEAEDFAEVTRLICEVADAHAEGRVVSMLEGGYDLQGLRDSCAAHLHALS